MVRNQPVNVISFILAQGDPIKRRALQFKIAFLDRNSNQYFTLKMIFFASHLLIEKHFLAQELIYVCKCDHSKRTKSFPKCFV
jgi:hypothetical protein